ncbi:GDP-mannose 4,6-dehydratase [Patescibacteria group bacterium]
MKYLVTGGCGFIGFNFSELLLKRGDNVTILDNLSRKGTTANLIYLQENYPKVKFVHADIRNDYHKFIPLMEKVDVVFHLAGQVAVTSSFKVPREDFEINALGTFNILEAIRQSKRKPTIIYASSNKVYGGMTDVKVIEENNRYKYKDLPKGIAEDRLLDFHSPYGCSKGVSDQYVRDYSRMYPGVKTVVMRQSCIYGKNQFGIEDQGWVAWFAIAAYFGKPITIFGDGKQVRDVLYVDDLFDAWDKAANDIDNVNGEIFNVGGGNKYSLSLLELLEFLEDKLDKRVKHTFSDWRPGDQPVFISDISKAKRVLKWKPTTSNTKGIGNLLAWIKENESIVKGQLKVS